MGEVFVLFVVLASSTGAYMWTRRTIPIDAAGLRWAVHILLECVGTAILFLAINTVTAVILVISVRRFTSVFISVYRLDPLLLAALSLLQGFLFWLGWQFRRGV
jgi:hypothetical protein